MKRDIQDILPHSSGYFDLEPDLEEISGGAPEEFRRKFRSGKKIIKKLCLYKWHPILIRIDILLIQVKNFGLPDDWGRT